MRGLNVFSMVLQRSGTAEVLPKRPLDRGMFNSAPLPSNSAPAQTNVINSGVVCSLQKSIPANKLTNCLVTGNLGST
jgi:hypothetical protein